MYRLMKKKPIQPTLSLELLLYLIQNKLLYFIFIFSYLFDTTPSKLDCFFFTTNQLLKEHLFGLICENNTRTQTFVAKGFERC